VPKQSALKIRRYVPSNVSVYVRSDILIPQIQRLQAQAKANYAANTAAYNSWVQSHTPLQIREANSARLTLSRLENKSYPPLKDDRLVTVSRSAYTLYLKERMETEYQGKAGVESFPAIGREWLALPQAEKDVSNLGSIDIHWILQMLTMNPALPQIANRRSSTV
jgi:hypothetical protein